MFRFLTWVIALIAIVGCNTNLKNTESLIVSEGDTVLVNFNLLNSKGFRVDGTLLGIGGPLRFVVGNGQVIQGFDKGVIGMSKDETRDLKLPPEEAYGAMGVYYRGNVSDTVYVVAPNDTLFLKIEMLDIKKAKVSR